MAMQKLKDILADSRRGETVSIRLACGHAKYGVQVKDVIDRRHGGVMYGSLIECQECEGDYVDESAESDHFLHPDR